MKTIFKGLLSKVLSDSGAVADLQQFLIKRLKSKNSFDIIRPGSENTADIPVTLCVK